MAQAGIIQTVIGVVKAQGTNGQVRELNIGDIVYENETVTTAAGASATITREDGSLIELAENSRLLLDDSVLAEIDPADATAEAGELSPLQEALVTALENDGDVEALLEETAAGQEQTADLDEAHDFRAGYHAGDNSEGNVGSYLLDVENKGNTIEYERYTVDDNDGNTSNPAAVTVDYLNPPTSTNDSISIIEDLSNTQNNYLFTPNDFGSYSDPDGAPLTAIRIDTLPTNGAIELNGVVVTAGQIINVADFTGANAGKLVFNPTDHTDEDSSFTFSVNNGTEWSVSSYKTVIDIDAFADKPLISLEGTATFTQEINIDNVNNPDGLGFNVEAFNADGSPGDISTKTTSSLSGFGVSGSASGHTTELGYNNSIRTSETLKVTFDEPVQSVDVAFAWLNARGEKAAWTLRDENDQIVGSGIKFGETDKIDPAITLSGDNGESFKYVVFSAPGRGDDYLIHSLTFEKTVSSSEKITVDAGNSIDIDLTSALVDTDGSESLSIDLEGIPAGAVLSDGSNNVIITAAGQSVSIDGWDIDKLSLTPQNDTDFTLTATATATEADNGSTATETATLQVNVQPQVSAGSGTGNIEGTDADDVIVNDDTETENIDGGAGDDIITFDPQDTIDGGADFDTLLVSQEGALDFSKISNIEKIDLSDETNSQTVTLTADQILDMTDNNNVLEFSGGDDDEVRVDATGWTQDSVDSGLFTNDVSHEQIRIVSSDDSADSFKILTDDGTEIG